MDKFRNVLSDPLLDYHVVAAKLLEVEYIVIRCLDNDDDWLPKYLKAGLILSDDDFMGSTVSAFLTSHFHDINGWGDPFRKWIKHQFDSIAEE